MHYVYLKEWKSEIIKEKNLKEFRFYYKIVSKDFGKAKE